LKNRFAAPDNDRAAAQHFHPEGKEKQR